ncbi:MAG: diguanylate cyclase [Pseudomonadota bacterium]
MAKKARFVRPEEEVHQRITRSYVFALSLIALTATSAFLSHRLSASIDERGDRVTTLLEHQAALSQRLALQANRLVRTEEEASRLDLREKLEATAARVSDGQAWLRTGEDLRQADMPRSRTLRALLAQPDLGVDGLFTMLLEQVDTLLQPGDDAADPLQTTRALTELAEGTLFTRLSTLADRFRAQQRRQVMVVEIIAALVYLLTLAGLALEARYVFAPIARETTDRTRQFAHARSEVSRLMQELSEGRQALAQVRDELRRRALHDELTGLPNRRCLMEYGNRAIANAQRGERVVALLYLELGALEAVNESLGYGAGDALLQEAADVLRTECREADFPARAGGDKLLLMVPDVQGTQEVEGLSARLLERFASPLMLEGQVVRLEVNIGIAVSTDAPGDFNQLLAKAQDALDEASARGSGHWYRFKGREPGGVPAVRDARFDPLRAALARDTVHTWYVPVVRADRTDSIDLRMSWIDGQGEMHGAHEVVRVDGYATLGDHLLERSIVAGSRALGRWQAAGYSSLRMFSVGVSVAQLRAETFAERVLSLLAEFAVEPDSLLIEVDDGELADLDLADEKRLCANLDALHHTGVGLSLANITSASALFVRLEHLAPERVKFAASFTAPDGLTLARQRGLEVIARAAEQRGIELLAQDVRDLEQAELLQSLGCHLQQGPLYAAPMKRSLVSAWLRERRGDARVGGDSDRSEAA